MNASPCAKNCPDRKAGCHNALCPHGWAEYEERHFKDLERKKKKIEENYPHIRTAAYYDQQIRNIKHLQAKSRRGK